MKIYCNVTYKGKNGNNLKVPFSFLKHYDEHTSLYFRGKKCSFSNTGKDFGIHGLAESMFKYLNGSSFKFQFNIQIRTLISTKEGQMWGKRTMIWGNIRTSEAQRV